MLRKKPNVGRNFAMYIFKNSYYIINLNLVGTKILNL